MTRQTSLHGWTVPTEGDTNYEGTFDDFFVDLDTNGEIRDTESSLSNYEPKSGAKFVATDTENEFIGDGTTWNQLQTSGKNPNFDSLSTEKTQTEQGQFLSVYTDDDGNRIEDGHDSIQGAIDALPAVDDADSAEGYVEITSNGAVGTGYDHEVTETVLFSHHGSRFVGTGIHTQIQGSLSDPIVEMSGEDTELAQMWVDNHGDGDTVYLTDNIHVHDLNIDRTGRIALFDYTSSDYSEIGPYVEVKEGPTAAIDTRGYVTIHECHVQQHRAQDTIDAAFRTIANGDSSVNMVGNTVKVDGNNGATYGYYLDGDADKVLAGNYVGASSFIDGSVGPTIGYYVRDSNCNGTGLVEDGSCDDGLRINGGVENVYMSGQFPSGVNFYGDITTAGAVVVEGLVGGISEQSAGYKNGQIVNGNSWNSGDPNSTGIWNGNADLAFRRGVTVWDTSASPNVAYEAGPNGNWN